MITNETKAKLRKVAAKAAGAVAALAESLHLDKRGGATLKTLRCSCGYEPPATDTVDIEELMSLHMAHVRALAVGDPER